MAANGRHQPSRHSIYTIDPAGKLLRQSDEVDAFIAYQNQQMQVMAKAAAKKKK